MSDFQTFFSTIKNYQYLWVLEVFLLVFFTLLAAFFLRRFLKHLESKAQKTHNMWDDGVVNALQSPSYWLVWLFGISFAADLVAVNADSPILALTNKVRSIGVMILLTWFLVRLIKSIELNLTSPKYHKQPMDATTAKALGKLLRASVVITAALMVVQNLGYSISGVLAFGGIGGLAIGLAAKDMLANFFGGLTVYLDRPFKVGDWVRSPDKEIEGTVEDIGWRITRIRTFDKRPLYVPNSTFTQISLENPSRMLNRRIKETIGIRYDDALKMDNILADVKAMLLEHPDIDNTKTLMVNFNSFAPSSLDFFIYTFTKTTVWAEYHDIKQDVLLKILNIIDAHGAECAFPTSTLHIASTNAEPESKLETETA